MMTMRGVVSAVLLSASAGPALAQFELRVARVAVFSSGVAYFEREATIEGSQTAELFFRTDQMNDVLKSLLVQDPGGAVGVVRYSSRDPIEKTLRSFAVDLTSRPSLAQLLDQLRGQAVEISGSRTIKGTIVGVERQKIAAGQTSLDVDVLNVLTDTGMVQLRVAELGGVRLLNDKVDEELRRALATLAGAHDSDRKGVSLTFGGQGRRTVRVAYLLEAPIWKTSYRLALTPEREPLLQGWATVENATEEDWKDVQLSLVAGRPISFTMDLYSPIYVPRPRVEMELYASLRPPTYDAAKAPASPAAASLSMEGAARRLRAAGQGPAEMFRGDLDAQAEQPFGYVVESMAEAEQTGELFEYAIGVPVSLQRQNSAMLPIVNAAVEAEKLSIYNPATHARHPLNGLQLTNNSGLSLMQGPVTVFDSGVYAGDARLPDLKPGEKRLVAYALDLDVEVEMKSTPVPQTLVAVKLSKGTLQRRTKYVDSREYVVTNKSDRVKKLLIEQPHGSEWKLVEPEKPSETARSLMRFRLEVPGRKSASQKVVLEQVAEETFMVSAIDADSLLYYIRSGAVSPKVREALQKVVELRARLSEAARERETREAEVNEAIAEQARVRQNVSTLDRSTDAYQRQLRKFDELETAIEKGRQQLASAREIENERTKALSDYVASLEIE